MWLQMGMILRRTIIGSKPINSKYKVFSLAANDLNEGCFSLVMREKQTLPYAIS